MSLVFTLIPGAGFLGQYAHSPARIDAGHARIAFE
jgi:hypothetical protein